MRRTLPSLLWLIAMYTATAFSESGPPMNLVELQRIVIHASGYLILGLAMAYAFPPSPRRTTPILLGLAAISGLGQEIMQAIARGHVYPFASLFDLGVDAVGASLGLLIAGRIRKRLRPSARLVDSSRDAATALSQTDT